MMTVKSKPENRGSVYNTPIYPWRPYPPRSHVEVTLVGQAGPDRTETARQAASGKCNM